MFEEPLFGLPGVDRFWTTLIAGNAISRPCGKARFPLNWPDPLNLRCDENCPSDWFRRIIRESTASTEPSIEQIEDAIQDCEIAEGLAIFVNFSWSRDHNSSRQLDQMCFQAFAVGNSDLTSFYQSSDQQCSYYRLEFTPDAPGNLFDHPFPHIHIKPDGAPRIPWFYRPDVFPILSFLEFLVINHHFNDWKRWLILAHAKHYQGGSVDPTWTLNQVFDAFRDPGEWKRVPDRGEILTELKEAAKQATKSLSADLPMIHHSYLHTNYWQ